MTWKTIHRVRIAGWLVWLAGLLTSTQAGMTWGIFIVFLTIIFSHSKQERLLSTMFPDETPQEDPDGSEPPESTSGSTK